MTARFSLGGRVREGALLLAVVAVAAGCGGGSTTAASPPPATSSPSAGAAQASGATAAVLTATGPWGTYLTDAQGRTLYLFEADKGSTSICYGPCAGIWPPLTTTGSPAASGEATTALLATTARTDGAQQVTYAGHPLYYFAKDKAAGDVLGQGVNSSGGLWWMLTPTGSSITTTAPASPPASQSSGGSGGGY